MGPQSDRVGMGKGPALEPIRFAGANLLCVVLGYQGSERRIRPYSLRVSRGGNLLLYAVKDETDELRSYRVDRIESVMVTTKPFTPTHQVEFRPTGEMSALPTARGMDRAVPRSLYRVECPLCGKVFPRRRLGTELNPHKDRGGFPCGGRRGYLT